MTTPLPACPGCGSNRHANAMADDQFYCSRCQCLYDNDPDEGGTHSDFNPAVRIERDERRREREQQRRQQINRR